MTTTVEIFYLPDRYNKDEWPAGPWTDEPDKLTWVDEVTDLDCMVHRGPAGALCGYVGVPKDHPWFGKDYEQVEPYPEVHGSLTFANRCVETKTDDGHGICHVPQPGRSDEVWWLGFDCAHLYDIAPRHDFKYGGPIESQASYKDMRYVVGEVEQLAKQAAAAA